jgi:uncharacterized protein YndB with AHSA1/START domain
MKNTLKVTTPSDREIVMTRVFDAPRVLTEQEGKTLLTLMVLYPSKKARDATIASGMERGVAASYDRLEDLLATMPTGGVSQVARG